MNPTANLGSAPPLYDHDHPFTYEHYDAGIPSGSLHILPLSHRPALKSGLDMLRRKPLVLLGISPGNAFFTRRRIEIAICAMAKLFGEVHVIVPDTIAIHTYRALGYSEGESIGKARKKGANIKNRCLRAIERARAEFPLSTIHMLDWEEDVATLPGYQESYEGLCRLFDTHPAFRQDILSKGRSVLDSGEESGQIPEAAVLEGIQYLLKEFAYMSICSAASDRDVVIPYHQEFNLGCGICDGQYREAIRGVGWLVYNIELEGE